MFLQDRATQKGHHAQDTGDRAKLDPCPLQIPPAIASARLNPGQTETSKANVESKMSNFVIVNPCLKTALHRKAATVDR
jgi:hypothetical protein